MSKPDLKFIEEFKTQLGRVIDTDKLNHVLYAATDDEDTPSAIVEAAIHLATVLVTISPTHHHAIKLIEVVNDYVDEQIEQHEGCPSCETQH